MSAAGPSSPRKPFYPPWPESNDDAEYFEIPPDHFLAQQRGGHKQAGPSSPAISPQERRRTSVSTSQNTTVEPPASHAAEPLAELANAIRAGIPALPMPTAPVVPGQHYHFADTVPRPAPFAEANDQMPDTSTLAAADFDVDVRSGFLPPEAPIARLEGMHEQLWETALDQAKQIPLSQGGGGILITQEQRRLARQWRRSIRQMPVLPLGELLTNDIRYARRGHLVLSFLAHFYIHSQPPPNPKAASASRSWLSYFSRTEAAPSQDEQDLADELAGKFSTTVPAAIAVPWVQLSQKLDLPPVLTYATTVLWNWAYIDPTKGLTLDNLRILETFTRTKSEEHFFLTSLLIEVRGVEALELMRVSLDEAFVGDRLARRRIAFYLRRLAEVIVELKKLLHDVRTDCDPTVFYWGIRPWFRGSDAPEAGELPGWHFEGVDPTGVRRSFSGPSAGQSSLIHAIDVFLDVDHTRRKPRVSSSGRNGAESRGADATFMERMQLYMPGHHRNFLNHLRNISFDDEHADEKDDVDSITSSESPDADETAEGSEDAVQVERPPPMQSHPIRSLALAAQKDGVDEGLPVAYDHVLGTLKGLRDEHMRIAYLYIVSQTRTSPPPEYAPLPKGFTGEGKVESKKEAATSASPASSQGAKGTGGTDLVSFLKDCRINTTNALISESSATTSTGSSAPVSVSGGSSSSSSTHVPASHNGQSSAQGGGATKSAGQLSLDTEADEHQISLQSESGLQVWAVNIAGWEPETEHFKQLVAKLLFASPQDREKVQKYYRQVDRTRSLAARLLPRLMYARQHGIRWETTRFAASREGRPFLESPKLDKPSDFNISHDSDWIVLAFNKSDGKVSHPSVESAASKLGGALPQSQSDVRVGVDVMKIALPRFEESLDTFAQTMDMALTTRERQWVTSSSDEREGLARLYDLWTHKEAFTKAVGKGLGFDFSTIEMAFWNLGARARRSGGPVLCIRGEYEEGYRFAEMALDAETQLVVAEGPVAKPLPDGFAQISPGLTREQAESQGVLTVWTMEQLVQLAALEAGVEIDQ